MKVADSENSSMRNSCRRCEHSLELFCLSCAVFSAPLPPAQALRYLPDADSLLVEEISQERRRRREGPNEGAHRRHHGRSGEKKELEVAVGRASEGWI